ncbi:RsmB/NOP family class I SAM-dependent RNA methyltransferase [Candidatus Soleaferrea massiliensis]|uniref:RsmB/NOP family class I SAM-dependent RNA methyltransferase n=1 Tax=Candidatus Soleaferrea massiliensis TaxID=1470354 RepID=UPI00058B62B9|nr:RsmB/NOP family class I SAM-dependent RNA methyltransferase [Candidatus Soleaferrea massiliensis]
MREYPAEFLSRMQALLKEDFPRFIQTMDEEPFRALRVNTLKCDVEKFSKLSPFALRPTPFCKESFYLEPGASDVGRHPYHHAGAYYVQEPSASSAAGLLEVQPGQKVLDLCAAPGGKSTQLAAKLQRTGLLWSNELVAGRAKILLSNIERMGIPNAVVSSMHPDKLCERLPGFFDRVLVDAPCSGEGMFRKEPAAIENWNAENVGMCAVRQGKILDSAAMALRAGGLMVYSTCTFSLEENEQTIDSFLKSHPSFELVNIDAAFGRPSDASWMDSKQDLSRMRRIFPSDGGEGHFMAKLRRKDGEEAGCAPYILPKLQDETLVLEFLRDNFPEMDTARMVNLSGMVYSLPEMLPNLSGMNILRAGMLCGRIKPGRFEPAHHLYTASTKEQARQVLDLHADDPDIRRYLHGEVLKAPLQKGYAMVCVDGMSLGFGKVSGGVMKNHYPKGLRILG